MVAETEPPPSAKLVDCPLLLKMATLREKVSLCSKVLSLLMVMSHGGADKVPGTLPAVNVVVHVTLRKSPPSPSVVQEIVTKLIQSVIHEKPSHCRQGAYTQSDHCNFNAIIILA